MTVFEQLDKIASAVGVSPGHMRVIYRAARDGGSFPDRSKARGINAKLLSRIEVLALLRNIVVSHFAGTTTAYFAAFNSDPWAFFVVGKDDAGNVTSMIAERRAGLRKKVAITPDCMDVALSYAVELREDA